MTKRAAAIDARHLAASLILSYFEVGQPFQDCIDAWQSGKTKMDYTGLNEHQREDLEQCLDCNRLAAALQELANRLDR